MAPDVFYMDHEETVSVTVFNAPTATVELYLTNEPVDTSIFSRVNVRTQLGKNNTYQTRVWGCSQFSVNGGVMAPPFRLQKYIE